MALVKPLGWYMTAVFNGERTFLSPVLRPVEAGLYRLGGVDERREQDWLTYTVAMLLFHVGGFLILYTLMRLQGLLPFNPAGMTAVPEYLSFNTAISFITNTNWQNYGGESTLSYLVQMLGLTHQNFLSAATGIVLAVALIRGFARASAKTVGNFWVDITRCTLYILIPICIPFALFLVWQGMPQTLGALCRCHHAGRRQADHRRGSGRLADRHQDARHQWRRLLQRQRGASLREPDGALQPNSDGLDLRARRRAHQCVRPHGRQSAPGLGHPRRHGRFVLGRCRRLLLGGSGRQPELRTSGSIRPTWKAKKSASALPLSALFAVITTAASCGAVNAMHDSFTALGGMIPLINIQLGEVIIGGVGAGLYGMLLFVIISVFVAGLMVGRTPEYVGKKIEAKEVKMAMLAILVLPLMYLGWTAVATVLPSAVASIANPGPHGFSEILYLFTSSTGNNGSAFGGITGNTPFYNTTGAVAMFVGRFFMIIPAMAIAGALAAKKTVPASAGTFPTAWRPVRRPPGRRDPDRRRPDLLPGARTRTDRRAARDERRHAVLTSFTLE